MSEQTTHVHLDVLQSDKARWVKASQRRSAKLGEYLLGLIQVGEAHQKAAFEALHGLGEGVPEYNRGVLNALGHNELYVEWNFARMEVERTAVGADRNAADAAMARKARAWAQIEALRQQAIEALDLSQWLP